MDTDTSPRNMSDRAMTLVERLAAAILRRLSRDPNLAASSAFTPERALAHLDGLWPGLAEAMHGKRVLDFGCGQGAHAVALGRMGARVVGLDIQSKVLAQARNLAGDMPVRFTDRLEPDERFDCVLSVNSMEHFSDPYAVLAQMKSLLSADGRILITFCPTWCAPYGAHMHYFTRVPWVHLIFPERSVMDVRSRYKSDGARRYEDVEGGLNRMTVARFQRLIRKAGLRVVAWKVDYVKGQAWAAYLPIVRELLANRVTATLRREA